MHSNVIGPPEPGVAMAEYLARQSREHLEALVVQMLEKISRQDEQLGDCRRRLAEIAIIVRELGARLRGA